MRTALETMEDDRKALSMALLAATRLARGVGVNFGGFLLLAEAAWVQGLSPIGMEAEPVRLTYLLTPENSEPDLLGSAEAVFLAFNAGVFPYNQLLNLFDHLEKYGRKAIRVNVPLPLKKFCSQIPPTLYKFPDKASVQPDRDTLIHCGVTIRFGADGFSVEFMRAPTVQGEPDA